jgi:hypothetical protein
METLQITKQNAIKAFNEGCSDVKAVLSNLFGKETFVPANVMDRIKTAEDAFAIKGISFGDIVNNSDTQDEIAYKILKVIVEVLNEGWVPDWKNSSQYKYYPWFDMSSGSGLSYDVYDYQYSDSDVGSRLCFKSRELAEYAGKQFIKLYTDFFIIK